MYIITVIPFWNNRDFLRIFVDKYPREQLGCEENLLSVGGTKHEENSGC